MGLLSARLGNAHLDQTNKRCLLLPACYRLCVHSPRQSGSGLTLWLIRNWIPLKEWLRSLCLVSHSAHFHTNTLSLSYALTYTLPIALLFHSQRSCSISVPFIHELPFQHPCSCICNQCYLLWLRVIWSNPHNPSTQRETLNVPVSIKCLLMKIHCESWWVEVLYGHAT